MYTVTFYSFKGGVGRSMALVNAGVQLAQAGKKVLLVDFDLEAPGLSTFTLGESRKNTRGVVDYLYSYLETGEAPSVNDYCYQASKFGEGGEIWIMPSGLNDGSYAKRLNSIDWLNLYAERDGYLLFEELRSQWQDDLKVDYVLIDSRTGHSDVEGVCTRQLPDAVCFLFFPNDQNLVGLERVNSLVKNEKRSGRHPISRHFVVSNVPELDDEDGILKETLERFEKSLSYGQLAGEIHHYPSLSLLNQDIFSLTRPKSKLTKEYSSMVAAIVRENLGDREGALSRLDHIRENLPEETALNSGFYGLEAIIERVLSNFSSDSEIRFNCALIYEQIGSIDSALELLTDETIEGSKAPALGYAARARLLSRRGESSTIDETLTKVFQSEGADFPSILDAISLITDSSSKLYKNIGKSKAIRGLSGTFRFFVATQWNESTEQLQAQLSILNGLLDEDLTGEQIEKALVFRQAAVACIGLGQFKTACDYFERATNEEQPDIGDTFNLAMAKWGLDELSESKDLLAKVLRIHVDSDMVKSTNYLQCIAIAYVLTGAPAEAKPYIQQAKEDIRLRPRTEFSAWSYLSVAPEIFSQHLDRLESFANGNAEIPDFISRAVSKMQIGGDELH